MPEKEIGVITEQGYAAGQFGYNPASKEDQEKLKSDKDDKNK